MSDYLDDLLVIGIIAIFISPFALLLVRKRRNLALQLVGVALVIAAVPIALVTETSLNGCCGAPSTGRGGWGYIIGSLFAAFGIFLIIISKRKKAS